MVSSNPTNVNSSIYKFPTEIWLFIFTLAIKRWDVNPSHLSRVCQLFRQIIVNAPLLWSTIDLTAHENEVLLRIRRSEDVPLSLIYNKIAPQIWNKYCEKYCIDPLRVESFTCFQHGPSEFAIFRNLRSLIIGYGYSLAFVDLVTYFPLLNVFDGSIHRFSDTSSPYDGPKSKLKALKMSPIFIVSMRDFFLILSYSPDLETVAVHLGASNHTTTQVSVPRLHSMNLQFQQDPSTFMKLLHLPALQTIALHYGQLRGTGISMRDVKFCSDHIYAFEVLSCRDIPSFIVWLQREGTFLRNLHISADQDSVFMLLGTLSMGHELCPDLIELTAYSTRSGHDSHLHPTIVSSDVLEALRARPNLTRLAIDYVNYEMPSR